MNSDCMTLHDLAAVEVFVSSADRVGSTFEVVRKAVETAKDGLVTGRFHGPEYFGTHGVVWSWFSLREPPKVKNDWHFSWGIRFPAVSAQWKGCDPPLPEVPHAFVHFSFEYLDFPLASLQPTDIPSGWRITPDKGT